VRDANESRMREVLATHGLTQVQGVSQNFVLVDGRGREWTFTPSGSITEATVHLVSADGEPFGHSTDAFAATGSVSGYRAACLSAEAQMSNHSCGYAPGDTDVHDMRLLHDRLGTSLLGRFWTSVQVTRSGRKRPTHRPDQTRDRSQPPSHAGYTPKPSATPMASSTCPKGTGPRRAHVAEQELIDPAVRTRVSTLRGFPEPIWRVGRLRDEFAGHLES
jgi:hypothetical protein